MKFMYIWCLSIGIAFLGYGIAVATAPGAVARVVDAFPRSRVCGWVLCAFGWLFAAYELNTIGIDVFDHYLKAFPGELWVLAAVLIPLTCWWMGNLLAVRGAAALMMLFPAEMFPFTRVATSDARLVLVIFAYICVILGMFSMFYPWRARQALTWIAAKRRRIMVSGALSGAFGAVVSVLGLTVLK